MPRVPPSRKTHGHSHRDGCATPEYRAWAAMKNRCSNPNSKQFHNYGARGIAVCAEWMSFENFLKDMGSRPTSQHSLDRIDNDGNYEPGNCRWADRTTQARNRRNNHLVTWQGRDVTVTEAAERSDADIVLVRSRIKRGWSIERALS